MRTFTRPVADDPANKVLAYGAHPTVFWRFPASATGVVSDAATNLDDWTLSGTVTSSLSGGTFTPEPTAGNMTLSAALPTAVDTYLKNMFDITTYSQILVAFDLYYTTAPSSNEGLFGIGDVTASDVGWTLQFLAVPNMRPSFVCRGVGGSTQSSVSPAGGNPAGSGVRNSVVIDLQFSASATAMEWWLNGTSIGTGAGDYGTSGTRPGAADFTDGLVLWAKAQSGGELPLGVDSVGTQLDNMFIQSRVTADANVGDYLAIQHHARKGLFPRGLL